MERKTSALTHRGDFLRHIGNGHSQDLLNTEKRIYGGPIENTHVYTHKTPLSHRPCSSLVLDFHLPWRGGALTPACPLHLCGGCAVASCCLCGSLLEHWIQFSVATPLWPSWPFVTRLFPFHCLCLSPAAQGQASSEKDPTGSILILRPSTSREDGAVPFSLFLPSSFPSWHPPVFLSIHSLKINNC